MLVAPVEFQESLSKCFSLEEVWKIHCVLYDLYADSHFIIKSKFLERQQLMKMFYNLEEWKWFRGKNNLLHFIWMLHTNTYDTQ